MTIPVNPSPAIFLPENAPFTPEQRSWLNGFFAGLVALNSGAPETRCRYRVRCRARARGRWRRAMARSDDRACRTHEARRRASVAAPDDGRDGAAGLRPVRLQLLRLCGCVVRAEGSAAESLRARRQGNRPHAEVAVRGARQRAVGRSCREELRPAAAPTSGVTRDSPSEAVFLSRRRLNKPGSEKETWHVEFDLTETGYRLQGRRLVRGVSRERSCPGSGGDRRTRCIARHRDRQPIAARRSHRIPSRSTPRRTRCSS